MTYLLTATFHNEKTNKDTYYHTVGDNSLAVLGDFFTMFSRIPDREHLTIISFSLEKVPTR